MIGKAKFYRRWKRRFRKILSKIRILLAECLDKGGAESIHDLRVTLRRARMLTVVGTPVLGKREAGEFRQWALRVTATLGRVRDLDVLLQWVHSNSPAAERDSMLLEKR